MSFPLFEVTTEEFPPLLREIPQPPTSLTYRGALPSSKLKLLAVVGSRKYSTYGSQVVDHLLTGLQGTPVGIVSGLALGIDSLAHEAALKNQLYTLAVPGSGLGDDVIYPTRHKALAYRILAAGGGLLSEFSPTFKATKWSFTKRNRIMAGICHATLMIEATEQSGTLITARMTTDYNRELLVVPGNIFSSNTAGTHQFLKLGATPVTTATDILTALNIDPITTPPLFDSSSLSSDEQRLWDILTEPMDKDTLIRTSNLSPITANIVLMQLEIKGLVAAKLGQYCRLH